MLPVALIEEGVLLVHPVERHLQVDLSQKSGITCLHMGGHSSEYLAASTRGTALLPLSVLSTTL